jgi:hypothetical protein
LLDWLAQELVRNGGRLKPLHRLIVTSAAYRQSSTAGLAPASDLGNRLLWRMNKRRLEAEAVRDSILTMSGTLNRQMGGPGIKPRIHPDLLAGSQRNKWPKIEREGPEHWRRSVYVYVKRQLALPLLELFDSPPTTQSCGRRQLSVVPTQALVLMNDEFTQDQAGYFADRVQREVGNDPAAQADRALRIAFCRSPSAARHADAIAFLRQQRTAHAETGADAAAAGRLALADLAHVLFNCNEFIYID